MEHEALLIDHVLENLFGRLKVIPLPVENLFADGLLFVVVKPVEIRMAWVMKKST
jgi:hypothetical protein